MMGMIPKRAAKFVAALLAATGLLAVAAGSASAEVVFNNNPTFAVGNVNSLNISQHQTSEFGGQVQLTHATIPSTVSVMMSSWACGNLETGSLCKTTAGASFEWPITLNIYSVGPKNQPGALIVSVTKTVKVPFRPSPSTKCPKTGGEANDAFGWYSAADGRCDNGKAFTVKYTKAELGNITLPEKVIIGAAFDDKAVGTNVGQWSLNIALTEKSFETPSVGAMPLLNTKPSEVWRNDVYLNSTEAFPYECARCTPAGMPEGSTVGTFGVAGEWFAGVTPAEEAKPPAEWSAKAYALQPVFKVEGVAAPRPTAYVAIGDSIAFGYKETTFNENYPSEPPSAFEGGYVGVFGAKLTTAEKAAHNALATVNLGCPGETSGGMIGNGPLGTGLEALRASKSEPALHVSSPCKYHNEKLFKLKTEQGPASELEYAYGLLGAGVNVKAVTINIGGNDELETEGKCANPAYDAANGFASFDICLFHEAGLTGYEYPGGLFTHIITNVGVAIGVLRQAGYTGHVVVLGIYNPLALFVPGSDTLQKTLNEHFESTIAGGAFGPGVKYANPFPLFNPQNATEKAHLELYTEIYNPIDIAFNDAKQASESKPETHEGDIHPTALGYEKMGALAWLNR